MVNIWLNHCPIDAEIMEDELCSQMKTPFLPNSTISTATTTTTTIGGTTTTTTKEDDDGDTRPKRGNLKRDDDDDDDDDDDTSRMLLLLLEWNRNASSGGGDALETKELMVGPDATVYVEEEEHVICNHDVTMTFRAPKQTLHQMAQQISNLNSKSAHIQFHDNVLSLHVGNEALDDDEYKL